MTDVIETLKAWFKPKDLSLVLEIEGTIDGGMSAATHGRYYEMLEPKYAGRTVVLVGGDQTGDSKTKFYVTPSIRGQKDNITWDELRNLYPSATHIIYYLESKSERNTIKVYAASRP
ncbi:MAG TPA: hypothetical protein VJI32_05965 [Candidatus Nanoarchaeia archaeon]|nr:hypothetical protein [Candidatus Nanoarchaeia archaeon]